MWPTSKLLNKYYILVTNSLMSLFDKVKRSDHFSNSSFLKLQNFHFYARFCSNMATFTLLNDDVDGDQQFKARDKSLPREEDICADLMVYEMARTFGDRIMMPSVRQQFL